MNYHTNLFISWRQGTMQQCNIDIFHNFTWRTPNSRVSADCGVLCMISRLLQPTVLPFSALSVVFSRGWSCPHSLISFYKTQVAKQNYVCTLSTLSCLSSLSSLPCLKDRDLILCHRLRGWGTSYFREKTRTQHLVVSCFPSTLLYFVVSFFYMYSLIFKILLDS